MNQISNNNQSTNLVRTPPKLTNRSAIVKYIIVDLWSWLKDLSITLMKLNFKDNFQSFLIENILIPANTEVSISNQFNIFYPGLIPSGRIIVRQQGDANILDGENRWTTSHVYLRNPSTNDAIISVWFFK